MGQNGSTIDPPRSNFSSGMPNNLPPLTFHRVHGENVRLSADEFTARRVESFCKGVAFSARPVRLNEKVYIRFVEISNSWSGVLRFGFTTHDPMSLYHSLPKYACPDLTNKPGNWAKALAERFCEKDNVLFFYVNSAGDVIFGINGEEKGIFFSGVDTRSFLWTLVDVYGNCTAIQFADPRLPNSRRILPHVDEEERLARSLSSINLDGASPPTRYQTQPVIPISLHRTKGSNVVFSPERGTAARIGNDYGQGYIFTGQPMRPGQTLVVQILKADTSFPSSLSIGLTSCDPGTLRTLDLPDDVEQLLDRPEYWVMRRNAANGMRRLDELAVTLTLEGEVKFSRNGVQTVTVMHVDHTLRLWAFIDIYGGTQKVRLLSSQLPVQTPQQRLRVQLSPSHALMGNGGTVLVVNLPPQNVVNHQGLNLAGASYLEPLQSTSQVCSVQPSTSASYQAWPDNATCSSSQNNSNQELDQSERIPQVSGHHMNPISHVNLPSTSHQAMYTVKDMPQGLLGTECTICYENPIDSVLYMCGHMCMCYMCAVQQWKGKGGGQCPLCRAMIKDVIRTYKS